MNKVAFLILGAIALLWIVCIRTVCECDLQVAWHEDAEDQWSIDLRDGSRLYVILESGDSPLFLVRSVCSNDPSGYTIAQKQWHAGDHIVEFVDCLNQVSHIDVPPLFEGLDPLPQKAQELLRKNWEQRPGSPNGEVLYAQGTFYHL